MISGRVARRYAKALFALAKEADRLEPIGETLAALGALAADPAVAPALANPLLRAEARRRMADALAESVAAERLVRNFLCLLADRQRLDHLARIAQQYERLVDEALGRVRATVWTAAPLVEADVELVRRALERLTGKTVVLALRDDPELLGGVVAEVEGKVYDGSLRTQLRRLAASIAGSRAVV